MFTGIIQAVGQLRAVEKKQGDCRLRIDVGGLDMKAVGLGDSIAVNGVCLTVVEFDASSFTADVSSETLSKTTLGDLTPAQKVNLEKALTLSTPLGGHLVSGHVDGVGTIKKRYRDGLSERFDIEVPAALKKYIAQKGSICIDGISLTVNAVHDARFALNIVPHTLAATTMGQYQTGQAVNVEVDLLARYIERLLQTGKSGPKQGMNKDFLRDKGFITHD
ncbi:MAG TPA: riboflavin synthase [Gammaproteobacteria bacterium]|nr:riboflavin synthase [Gammaproteobacteria bacterium]